MRAGRRKTRSNEVADAAHGADVVSGTRSDLGDVSAALHRATDHLFSLQHEGGYWKGELETNVTMDAEDLLLREFLGVRDEAGTKASAAWIGSQQRSDGTWSNYYEGPPDLSTTIEAYVALRLAGDAATEPHMAKAAEFVRGAGGLERSRVFTRLWMALFGLWSWDDLPALPPEVIFLPPWFPLNVYDFACWARQTIVALTVVAAHRPSRPLGFGIEELRASPSLPPSDRRRPLSFLSELRDAKEALRLLDKVLHGYERLARRPLVRAGLRQPALAAAERWILRRQEADGGWGGIQPPWVYSLMALSLRGYALDHPVMAKGLAGLESFTIKEDGMRRLEACQSPVWDTALALIGLADAGVDASDERVACSVDWLLGKEITVRGDWAVRRPQLAPGGWAFEFANDNYPDIDDTAEVILALRRATEHVRDADGRLPHAVDGAVQRGRIWVTGMVSKDGGWGAFDADNTRELCKKLPFCDFGAVIDPPSADVTAHVLEMLAYEAANGNSGLESVIEAGVRWLERSQEADGSWFGRWGANYVYGTGAAIPALVAAGTSEGDARVRRGVAWLAQHQNADGGFGEDMRSYVDTEWHGRGASTASQTAWALLGLVAAGEAGGTVARRAASWLARTQRPDGTWDEPWYTGTGFPGDFYINYHLYRLVWPVSALGRWLAAVEDTSLAGAGGTSRTGAT
jgi:squalene-hopene/tetraprenyl-beta-curcumene cyclase